jgi:thiamine-monophosphate kinase
VARDDLYSDEPTRVDQLVDDFLSGQSGSLVGPEGAPDIILSVGADAKDDCAVFDVGGPVSVVVGSDYVRGSRFILYELGLLSAFDIGYYLVVANLSDIAAMGATPLGVLTVVRYPKEMNDAAFRDVMAGIHQACADFGTLNVGGDIGNAERLILSGSALGVCPIGTALTRHGASAGDLLCVTGPCGLLGAAVAYFPKREANSWVLPSETERVLIESWQRPRARIAEGRLLTTRALATACQDTSDGLKATVEQLAAASGVGFDVHTSAICIHPAVTAVASLLGVDPLTLSLSASADFQLAFTIREVDLDRCHAEFVRSGLSFKVVGRATDQPGEVRAVDRSGATRPLPGVTWRHQQSDISTLVPDSSNVT